MSYLTPVVPNSFVLLLKTFSNVLLKTAANFPLNYFMFCDPPRIKIFECPWYIRSCYSVSVLTQIWRFLYQRHQPSKLILWESKNSSCGLWLILLIQHLYNNSKRGNLELKFPLREKIIKLLQKVRKITWNFLMNFYFKKLMEKF